MMLNILKIRLLTLRDFYEQYEKAEGNPHLQNVILGAMRYDCDKLNISVLDFIQGQRAGQVNLLQALPKQQELAAVPAENERSRQPLNDFHCAQCNRTFATQKALSGHQKAHRRESSANLITK